MSSETAEEKSSDVQVEGSSDRIVIDGAYLLHQVRDAMLTFLAPLNGVVEAAMGGKQPAGSTDRSKERTRA